MYFYTKLNLASGRDFSNNASPHFPLHSPSIFVLTAKLSLRTKPAQVTTFTKYSPSSLDRWHTAKATEVTDSWGGSEGRLTGSREETSSSIMEPHGSKIETGLETGCCPRPTHLRSTRTPTTLAPSSLTVTRLAARYDECVLVCSTLQ